MKAMFLALFLLLISSAQAISVKNFNINSTSIQINGQEQEVLGKLYGNGSIENSTNLNHKDVFVASENQHKHELSVTIRKGGGGGGGGGGRGGGGGGGLAALMRGIFGGGRHSKNAAPSLFRGTHFWVLKFIFYLSLALTILFPIH